MKRLFILLFTIVLLAGCRKENVVKIAATSVPHAEILEYAKPLLKDQGINIEVIVVQDYVTPNQFLDSEDVDLNYFQHIPYLQAQKKEFGYQFEAVAKVHIEPIGIYSNVYDDVSDIKKGAKVIFSSSVADHGRILYLLEVQGLIKLREGVEKQNATVQDIELNPLDLKFIYDIEAGLLPEVLKNNEGELVVINTNYALQAGLNPLKDAVAIEGEKSLYVNVLVARKSDENDENIKKIIEILTGKEVSNFILEKYKGAVVPLN